MSSCCVDPITIAVVTTGRGAGAGALRTGGLAGFIAGFGAAEGLGAANPVSVAAAGDEATARSAASFGMLVECMRSTDAVPAATATNRINAPNQEKTFTSRSV